MGMPMHAAYDLSSWCSAAHRCASLHLRSGGTRALPESTYASRAHRSAETHKRKGSSAASSRDERGRWSARSIRRSARAHSADARELRLSGGVCSALGDARHAALALLFAAEGAAEGVVVGVAVSSRL